MMITEERLETMGIFLRVKEGARAHRDTTHVAQELFAEVRRLQRGQESVARILIAVNENHPEVLPGWRPEATVADTIRWLNTVV